MNPQPQQQPHGGYPIQDGSSQEQSAESSATPSRHGSPERNQSRRKERPRVRFTAGGESLDQRNQRSTFNVRGAEQSDPEIAQPKPASKPRRWPPFSWTTDDDKGGLQSSQPGDYDGSSDVPESRPVAPVSERRPPILNHRSNSSGDFQSAEEFKIEEVKDVAGRPSVFELSAQERAQRLARSVGTHSAPGSRTASPARIDGGISSSPLGPRGYALQPQDIPMVNMKGKDVRNADEDTEDDDEDPSRRRRNQSSTSEAHRLVRQHTKRGSANSFRTHVSSPGQRSGQVTPLGDRDPDTYVPPPRHYRGGILSSLLKLYDEQGLGAAISDTPSGSAPRRARHLRGSSVDTIANTPTPRVTPHSSPPSSGRNTPKPKNPKWYKSPNHSTTSLSGLISSSTMLAQPGGAAAAPKPNLHHPPVPRPKSTNPIGAAFSRISKPRLEDEIRITIHIAETLSRQKFLVKLCRALMKYGAPTHRLEEYMRMTARVLEIDGQFLYLPGCMIISFDDASTHTTEVRLVRSTQGVDLGKLRDTHEIYKEVVHDVVGVEEATQRLDEIIERKQKHPPWLLVLVYGLASASVGPFAFGARFIDLPVAFFLGCLLGILQLIVAPKSDLYSNVFEISAAVLTSFIARAMGSIKGGSVFCFSALAQSSIALILPGYTVLCGSLELQSRSIVAGSVRMVYAIIYSLFLGFGITIGTAIYGLMDKNATSATTCSTSLPPYYAFIFVPPFTMCLIVINQAKWRQAPVMLIIAFAGYVVNYFSAKRFTSNAQIANTLGAFAVGVLGNLYSRLQHGVAAAALLPAIFVQVPSGLAASGSLVSGVTSANQITGNTTGTTTVSNGTQAGSDPNINSMVFNVGYSMIQVAIGITVGLFLSALVIYPFGKRRSGLFSF